MTWRKLNREIVKCNDCPRLREHCSTIAATKRRAYQDWKYWGQPVPNLGELPADLLIVGLAPAAHGANRTGRMFTGDRSGDWLFRALHRAGFANQPRATDRRDGLKLQNCVITAACHCAPPENKPTRQELENCHRWLSRTIDLVQPRVLLAFGQIGWKATIDELIRRRWCTGRRPRFGHGEEFELPENRWLMASYHPSQQNTFTGRLTEPMFDSVFTSVRSKLS